ncbi:hypothetical protein M378DRAFT_866838 [Amanita muscaria Koide BX008]|uniref:Uncharacterized protein n=1 Tax=Amanita muscaria (strain Koide BX008) TaxID=946122 RepID=A0A0C2T3P8_AMAMK|nr:hypothetical protein M378DRAFT_866838 [Amanita muscaria Koide BX008]
MLSPLPQHFGFFSVPAPNASPHEHYSFARYGDVDDDSCHDVFSYDGTSINAVTLPPWIAFSNDVVYFTVSSYLHCPYTSITSWYRHLQWRPRRRRQRRHGKDVLKGEMVIEEPRDH